MAEKTTIARPYAQAMFESAKEKGNMDQVAEALQIAAAAVSDPALAAMIGNPDVADDKIIALLIDLCGDRASTEVGNFFKLLAEYDRLAVLPEISALFERYRAEEERTIEAEVISASELNDAQKTDIASGLKKRLGRDVTLACRVDESLIGGAIIRAGDLVIDGSITSQLTKLGHALSR
ncbi:ATP synthase F0F1 subunit delta [Candidatus Tenderia electrophaga]|jgi:F-type H+-transporting ATPase subunit delta|uniref:ATP synthase subunit delta n=1 Tax=Candidatus Tenderia electrophaga TaxID=1748243 RepID=A0A0S2TGG8_9GAMM|nr:ATP synthase F0F1 subunit delta [Candidatus Tenderia electrophaga]